MTSTADTIRELSLDECREVSGGGHIKVQFAWDRQNTGILGVDNLIRRNLRVSDPYAY